MDTQTRSYPVRRPPGRGRAPRRNPIPAIIAAIVVISLLIGAVLLLRPLISAGEAAVPETLQAFSSAQVLEPLSNYPVYVDDTLYLSSHTVLLIDITDGRVICEKNAAQLCKIASLTKIMTAIVAIENLPDLDAEYTMSAGVVSYLTSENASVAGFEAGETVTARDLLYAAMLPSGGDGAMGLADLTAGSQGAFVDMMNAKALELGMRRTHFSNATGFDTDDNYSCALDVSIMFEYALKNDLFREVITTPSYVSAPTAQHPDGITMVSTVFKGYSTNDLDMGHVLGGKTGYTGGARLCLATYAQKDGVEYILITLGAGNGSNKPQYNFFDSAQIYSAFVG